MYQPKFSITNDILANVAERPQVKGFLTVEMSYGQMLEDVQLGVSGFKPVKFYGRSGGGIPTEKQILQAAEEFD